MGFKNSLTTLWSNFVFNWSAAEADFTIANFWMDPTGEFDHLRLIMRIRGSQETTQMGNSVQMMFNNDTTSANYYHNNTYTQNGASTITHYVANDYSPVFFGGIYSYSGGTGTAETRPGTKTMVMMDFYNWNSTTLKKVFRGHAIQADYSADVYGGYVTGMWNSTAAITSIKWSNSNYFMQGCTWDWYGFNS